MSESAETIAAEPKTRTITLTDRPPVRIREDNWPMVANGYSDHYAGVEEQGEPLSVWQVWLTVRQHADGRMLCYGRATRDIDGKPDYVVRAGELYETRHSDGDLAAAVAALRVLRAQLLSALPTQDETQSELLPKLLDRAQQEALASLPAEDIG